MSINHHLSSDIPQTPWWTQHNAHPHPHPHPLMENPSTPKSPNSIPQSFNFNPNRSPSPNLPMFEKPLTPSDVGKLNRLVIPKQYAEKYFPLAAADSGEKGFLLCFEDDSGKPWKFRYSYWSSSQSYVLTKGWSRFVKEKRLDAGDVVFFERHSVDCERFFIGWRRRVVSPEKDLAAAQVDGDCSSGGGWGRVCYNAQAYPTHSHGPPLTYQAECLHAGVVSRQQRDENGNENSNNNKKLLRLFGVNLECQPDDYSTDQSTSEPIASDGSSSFSSDNNNNNNNNHAHAPPHHYYYSSSLHSQMDMNLAGDVNNQQMWRYHQG
ncbi:hypothetical protein LguiB_034954 [Lonicera macranthoides]